MDHEHADANIQRERERVLDQEVPHIYNTELGVEPFIDPDFFPRPTGWDFADEREMIEFFARNLGLIEPGLDLLRGLNHDGLEYPCGVPTGEPPASPLLPHPSDTHRVPRIDILATDAQGNFVVIECKLNKAQPSVLGQVAGYSAWIKRHIMVPKRPTDDDPTGTAGFKVRAIVLCKAPTRLLRYALAEPAFSHVQVFTYTTEGQISPVSSADTDPPRLTDLPLRLRLIKPP